MGTTVKSAPAFLPEGSGSIMEPSMAEHSHAMSLEHYARQPHCDVPLYIGVFFDGTNNNRDRDEPLREHSNIVRLYNAHSAVDAPPPARRELGHYRIYVPGVGTRFDANEEWRESMEGKSMGKGGQARILFGLLEVVNSVHRAFVDNKRLFDMAAITEKLYDYVQRVEVGTHDIYRNNVTIRESRRAWMERLAAEVQASIRKAHGGRERPHYPFIRVNVFGFSRGAAQARAFCYWLSELVGPDRQLAGIPVQLGFVGLFDCVASVGLSHSVNRSLLGLGFLDGHFDWAEEILGDLPVLADRCVHMVAGHEQRLNFPLTRVKGQNVTEIVYPGVHSDVGGGYEPGNQGRAGTESELLSQIPLAHMHRLARGCDVPLISWDWMDPRLQRDYAISPRLVGHWNAYMEAADADWQLREGQGKSMGKDVPRLEESGDFDALVRQHRRLYLSWRQQYLDEGRMGRLMEELQAHAPGKRSEIAWAQDVEDITSANRRLSADVELLRLRREAQRRPQAHMTGQGNARETWQVRASTELRRRANLLPRWLSERQFSAEDKGLDWALAQFDGHNAVRGQGHFALLEEQVHDSMAGFTLIGYATPEDKAEKLLAIVREARENGPQGLPPYQRSVYDAYESESINDENLRLMIETRLEREKLATKGATDRRERLQAQAKYSKESVFRPDEQARAAALFPVQKDEHAATIPEGIEKVARLITDTRQEGGGYLLPRAFFLGDQ